MIQKNQHMKQLKFPLESIDCRYYHACGAPMCPKDVNFGRYLWFPSEPVCRLKMVPDWVRKQRNIAKLSNIDTNKYFTLRMLNSIEKVSRGTEGIDPEYYGGEKLWLSRHSRKKAECEASQPETGTDSEIILEIDEGTYSMFF